MSRRPKAWLPNGTGRRPGRPGFYVHYNDYTDGRRVQRTQHFERHADAVEWCRVRNAETDLRKLDRVIPRALDEAAAEFVAASAAKSASTRGQYQYILGVLHGLTARDARAGRSLPCSALAGDHLDRLIAYLLARGITEATAARHVRLLRAFFAWARKRGYMLHDPLAAATTLPSPHVKSRLRPNVTPEQLAAIATHLDTEDRRLAFWLALTTGQDRGVIAGLTPAMIDWQDRVIRFQRPKTRRAKAKMVTALIHPDLLPELRRRCAESPPDAPVLKGLARQEWSARKREDWWKRAVTAAGVPTLLFRDLRALASASLQRAGVPLTAVRDLLGHSSIQMTADHYSPPDPAIAQGLQRLRLPGFPDTPAHPPAQ